MEPRQLRAGARPSSSRSWSRPIAGPRVSESGAAALVSVLMLLLVFMALAAILTASTQTFQRATREDELRIKSALAAEAGAQVALSMIRSSDGTLADTNFDHTVMNHLASVSVTKTPPSTYSVVSTTGFTQVELLITTDGGFDATAAVSIEIDQPTVMSGDPDFTVRMSGGGGVSGYDHDALGNVLSDQINGTFGFSVSHNNAGAQVVVDGSSANINGELGQYDNYAPHKGDMIRAIVDHVRANADHSLTGGKDFSSGETGSFGTVASPKLVYCDASDDDNYKLKSGFEGAGILVVENSGDSSLQELFDIDAGGRWTGLVIVYAKNTGATSTSVPLLDLAGAGAVRGHVAVYVETPDLQLGEDLLVASNAAVVQHSKEAVDNVLAAAGLDTGILSIEVLGFVKRPAPLP